MTWAVQHGDAVACMLTMDPASVDAIVTDPPYGLEFMGKEWDAPWESDPHVGKRWQHGMGEVKMADGAKRLPRPDYEKRSNVRCRTCGKWRVSSNPCVCAQPDFPNIRAANMVAFQEWCVAWAREAIRVLKPGGHLLAFGGTRTYHRLTCAIEDAGFEIRDCLAWLYGSGFPKALDVSKAIDKAAGEERPRDVMPRSRSKLHGDRPWMNDPDHRFESKDPITAAAAAAYKGWATALKPAFEPIVLARKPLVGTVAANVQAHGTGALNIDGCRVATEPGADLGGGAEKWTRHSEGWDRPWMHDPEAQARQAEEQRAAVEKAESTHPTVKPVDLMRWLCRLITPKGGLILDPFCGSGSTGVAALSEGFRFIGIEREAEYVETARRRIAGPLFSNVDTEESR